MQYYDIYPKEGHPSQVAPLVPGKATTMIETRHPIHAVMLDEGAFRVIWGIVEDQAMSRFDTRETKPASAALLRAVGSFRHSFVEQNGDGTVEATESGQDEPERPRKVRVKRIRNRQAVEEEVEIPRRRTMVRKPAEEVSTTELTRDAQRVLRVLKKAGVPLGKADVLAKAGLADEADWLPAIKDLLRTGLVTQTGLKRGAKYGVTK